MPNPAIEITFPEITQGEINDALLEIIQEPEQVQSAIEESPEYMGAWWGAIQQLLTASDDTPEASLRRHVRILQLIFEDVADHAARALAEEGRR